jgi:predicted ATPase
MDMLTRLDISGFKSIKQLSGMELRPLNVLIGANGAGKSNLISFFKMLNWMLPSPGNLQLYIGRVGGANILLHDGAAVTPQITAQLSFATGQGVNEYRFRLFHAAGDTLVFADEAFRFIPNGRKDRDWVSLGAGHREAQLIERTEQGDPTARFIHTLLRRCVVYQFHNTSETARVRQRWGVDDNWLLKDDAANLAPVLLRIKQQSPPHYTRIVSTIRQIAPFFADFELVPSGGTVLLQWREQGSDMLFSAHQASDGTLRVMALVTLLLQPDANLPDLIILDEPELGLHPFAINVIAGLLKSAATSTQVFLSTQSMTLIDYFEPEDIIVVDRPDRDSTFRRLDSAQLDTWLDDYSLAELWEKNVIGGRPA